MGISSHRSMGIPNVDFDDDKIEKIICMAEWHVRNIKKHLARNNIDFDTDKIVTLKKFGSVPDPICGPMEEYQEVYDCLKDYCVAHIKDICGLGRDPILDAE